MKKKLLIVLPVALIILVLTGYFTLNNSRQPGKNEKPALTSDSSKTAAKLKNTDKKKSCCSEDMEEGSTQFSDNSIYQLDARWSNEVNKKVSLGELKGQKVVMAMIFASCTYACPLIVNDMRKVEAAIPQNEKNNVKFILVSIDPERDSPKALLEYSKKQNLDLSHWELLTGNKDDIRSLAAMLGFKYKKNENGDYVHSNLINVFNKQGEVVLQHEGLNKDVQDIVKELKVID